VKVAVLGGGVTGLTAAWRLHEAGHRVRVLEASPRTGGAVRTDAADSWLVEAGPNAMQEPPEVASLVDELGLGEERITALPGAKNRFVVRDGELVAVPTPSDLAGLISTPLLSFGSKLKVSAEMTRSPKARTEDVSVADLVREHFGAEILDRFVQPLVGGIYAGDAELLSTQHAFPKVWEAEKTSGSLVRAALEASKRRKALGLPPPSLISFRHGLQALPDALASKLPKGSIELESKVLALGAGGSARWRVDWEGPKGPQSGQFDWVVSAIPAWALAGLAIGDAGKRALSALKDIRHPPVASVFVGFRREQVRHPLDGFGALVPASEKRSILGAVFSSSLFAGRAPQGHVAVTAFAGGALQEATATLPKAELTERVLGDLRDLLGAEGKPAFLRHALWKRAIPQYELGHGRHLAAFAQCELDNPGLLIGGNARDGISLPDCILSGAALSERVS
jgi:protoporphyrinogen/coproporphyrinogen III oxidase